MTVTDTFVHLVPIKVQSSGLFTTLWCWEGTASRIQLYGFCRATDLFVVNLTHETRTVQFLCAQGRQKLPGRQLCANRDKSQPSKEFCGFTRLDTPKLGRYHFRFRSQ